MRSTLGRIIVVLVIAFANRVHAGLLETSDPAAFIRGPLVLWPDFLLGDTADFSVLCWLQRDQIATGTSNVLRVDDFSIRLGAWGGCP